VKVIWRLRTLRIFILVAKYYPVASSTTWSSLSSCCHLREKRYLSECHDTAIRSPRYLCSMHAHCLTYRIQVCSNFGVPTPWQWYADAVNRTLDQQENSDILLLSYNDRRQVFTHTHTHTDSVQGWWLWEGNHRSGRKQWQPAVGFVINVTCLINWRSATALKSLGTVACTGPCLTASTKQKGCLAGQLGPGLPGSPSSLPSHNTRAVITLILWEISEAVGTPFPNCWGYLLELC